MTRPLFAPSGFLQRLKLFLELSNLDYQVRKPAQGGLLAKALPVREGGCSADDRLGGDIVGNAAAGGEHRSVPDLHVIANGTLAPYHDARAKANAARQPRLANDDAVRANLSVVTDLNEVIDLGSMADAGGAELGAVDADARADLDIVFDDTVPICGILACCCPSQRYPKPSDPSTLPA